MLKSADPNGMAQRVSKKSQESAKGQRETESIQVRDGFEISLCRWENTPVLQMSYDDPYSVIDLVLNSVISGKLWEDTLTLVEKNLR